MKTYTMYGLMKTLLFLLITTTAIAQQNYQPGRIITTTGEQRNGFIDFQDWIDAPKNIKFRSTVASESTTYAPRDLSEFSVANVRYVSAEVEVEESPYLSGALEQNSDFKFAQRWGFLKEIITGDKELYLLRSGKENFYIKTPNGYELLRYKEFERVNQSGRAIPVKRSDYKKQLLNYLQDCPALVQSSNDLSYNVKSLSKFFAVYSKCSNASLNIKSEGKKVSIRLGVIAGVTMTKVRFENIQFYQYLENTDFAPSFNPTFGISPEILFNVNRQRWSILPELIYTKFEIDGYTEDIRLEDFYYLHDIKIAADYLRIHLSLRHYYPLNEQMSLFANVGYVQSRLISITDELITEKQVFTVNSTEEGKALGFSRNSEVGVSGGLGAIFNHLAGEIRYERSNGLSDIPSLNSPTHRFYFLLKYNF